jgi:short-subunit dehydrogenase
MPTALVTGATSGIGAGFADRYARLGHHLVLVARDEARLRAKADELRDRWHVAVEVLPADLSVSEGCARVEARLTDSDRPIDVLVNNAGYSLGVDVVESDVDDEDRMLRVLTRAPLRLTKAVLPGMLARNRGAIITVSSVAGIISHNTYGAAKSWALKFSQALSLRLSSTGVRAIALCPGLVHTEFHQRSGVDASAAPKFMWLTVDRVVDECLRDLAKGKTVSMPSRRYRVLVGIGARLPSSFTARVARNRGVRRPGLKAGR